MRTKLNGGRVSLRVAMRFAVLALAGLVALSGVAASDVLADPANDAMAKLNELSRQAEQTTEAMHSAQLDLNNKLAVQRTAEKKHTDDQAAADSAKSRLATYQTGVDKFAAAMYMGGRTDGMNAIMTAESPQQLIGKPLARTYQAWRELSGDRFAPSRLHKKLACLVEPERRGRSP